MNIYSQKFNQIKLDNETFIWTDKPNFTIYILELIPLILIAIIWFTVDYYVFLKEVAQNNTIKNLNSDIILYVILSLIPVWLILFAIIMQPFYQATTFYVLTNQRLIIKSRIISTDFNSYTLKNTSNLEVTVGWIG
jgi:hypothetical protein